MNAPAGKAYKFSVIIPVYNGSKSIVRAVDSVLAQSYAAFEIIVVDDASKDDTVNLLQERYGDKINLVQKIANQGAAAARNAGMDKATGDYLAFLDADDIWHYDKLMLLNAIFAANAGITIFYHSYTRDAINERPLPEDITLYKLPFVKLLSSNPVATSCMVIKNNPAFRFEPSMRYTEDYDLALRIAYKYKIYFIQQPLTQIFRTFTTQGGISENKWKMRKGELRAYRRLAKLNPLFTLLLPFLYMSSLGRHLIKKFVSTPGMGYK